MTTSAAAPPAEDAPAPAGAAPLADHVIAIAGLEMADENALRAVSVEEDEWMDDYLWNVNLYINEHIRFSDTKAGSVIVLGGAMLSLLFSGAVQHEFTMHPLRQWNLASYGALGSFLCLAASVLTAAWSIRPRLVRTHERGFIFWESVRAHGSPQAFVRAVNSRTRQELLDHLSTQIFHVSGVCSAKFGLVSRAITLALIGGLLGGAVLLLR